MWRKLNTRIHMKSHAPEYFKTGKLKKQTEYIQLDTIQMMADLTPSERIELHEAYIGYIQKLSTRVIIHRLTEDQPQTSLKN